jgi:hypothetical protein
MLHDTIHSYCIRKLILETKRNLKKSIPIQSHISRIPSTSTLNSSFVRYRSSEFPPSLESLWNFLWLWYSGFPSISLRLSPNSEVAKPFPSIQTKISSSHQQISTIITSESLVGLRHMGSRQKSEKVSYNIGIQCFLRFHPNWGQKLRILRMLKFVQDRILVIWLTSKNHNS